MDSRETGANPERGADTDRDSTMSRIEEALLLAQSRARAAEEALSLYDNRVEETAFRALALLEESRCRRAIIALKRKRPVSFAWSTELIAAIMSR